MKVYQAIKYTHTNASKYPRMHRCAPGRLGLIHAIAHTYTNTHTHWHTRGLMNAHTPLREKTNLRAFPPLTRMVNYSKRIFPSAGGCWPTPFQRTTHPSSRSREKVLSTKGQFSAKRETTRERLSSPAAASSWWPPFYTLAARQLFDHNGK